MGGQATGGGRATPGFGPLARGSASGGDTLDDGGGEDQGALAGNQDADTGDTETGSMGVDTAALGGGAVTAGGLDQSDSGPTGSGDVPTGGLGGGGTVGGAANRLRRGAGRGRAMRIRTVASDIGKGLFAGFAGTLAISASQAADMALRDRPASSAPADAAGKVLGVQPTGDAERQRFSQIVHFGYGTGWGAVRGLIGAMGLTGTPAMLAHFAAVYGTALVMLPALKVAPPVAEWGAEEIALDAWHHFVYAAAVNAAYERMNGDKL